MTFLPESCKMQFHLINCLVNIAAVIVCILSKQKKINEHDNDIFRAHELVVILSKMADIHPSVQRPDYSTE